MKFALVVAIAVSLEWTIVAAINSTSDPVWFDVNGDGKVDAIDLMLVSQHFGDTYPSNPCLVYNTTPVTFYTSDGTPWVRHANYELPVDHPLRAAFDLGSPIPLRPC